MKPMFKGTADEILNDPSSKEQHEYPSQHSLALDNIHSAIYFQECIAETKQTMKEWVPKMVAWLKLGRVAGISSPNIGI